MKHPRYCETYGAPELVQRTRKEPLSIYDGQPTLLRYEVMEDRRHGKLVRRVTMALMRAAPPKVEEVEDGEVVDLWEMGFKDDLVPVEETQ